MPLDLLSKGSNGRWVRAAWGIWIVVALAIIVRGHLQPNRNNCFPCYRAGGLNWLNGEDLYQRAADTCRYSPFVHALLGPFCLLPEPWDSTIWRATECVLLLGAMSWWMRAVCPVAWSDRQRGGVLLFAIILFGSNLYSGQSNALVMAGILASWSAASRGRWWLGAFALSGACLFKIYPLALGMLLSVIAPRRFAGRFAAALAIGALLPFLFHDPGYIVRQYQRWLGNLTEDDRSAWPLVEGYRDAWMLVRVLSLPISVHAYRLFTLAAGAAIGLLVLARCRQGTLTRDRLNVVLGLGTCWMTVFGPATEGHTYIYVGATLAWLAVECGRRPERRWMRAATRLAIVSFLFTFLIMSTPLGRQFPWYIWQPVGTLAILVVLVRMAIRQPLPLEAHPAIPAAPSQRRLAA